MRRQKATTQPESAYMNNRQPPQIIPLITGGSDDDSSIDNLHDNFNSDYSGNNIEVTSNSSKDSSSSTALVANSKTRQGGRFSGHHYDSKRYYTTGVIEDIKVI